jgi:hypothetical protein
MPATTTESAIAGDGLERLLSAGGAGAGGALGFVAFGRAVRVRGLAAVADAFLAVLLAFSIGLSSAVEDDFLLRGAGIVATR